MGSRHLRAPGFHSFHSQGAHRGPEAPFQAPAGEQAPDPSVCPAPSSPCFGDTEPFSQREVQAGPRPGWASDYSLPLLEPMSQSDGGSPHLLNTCLAVGHGETSWTIQAQGGPGPLSWGPWPPSTPQLLSALLFPRTDTRAHAAGPASPLGSSHPRSTETPGSAEYPHVPGLSAGVRGPGPAQQSSPTTMPPQGTPLHLFWLRVHPIVGFLCFFSQLIYFLERAARAHVCKWGRGREREGQRESQAGSTLSTRSPAWRHRAPSHKL